MNNQYLKDVSKLPKWAQERIADLERSLRETRQELYTQLEHPVSEVAVERFEGVIHGNGPRFVYLPERAEVVFFLDDRTDKPPFERQAIHVRRKFVGRSRQGPGSYYLEVSTGGGSYPSVQAQASNVIRVRLADEP